jgi:voltage-dependent calcium channel L type alpha-1D
MFVYCLLGMEFFAHRVKINSDGVVDEDGVNPNSNFNTFSDSIATVFVVLANDGWSPIYYNHYMAVSGPIAVLFFVSLLMLGQFLILNLFLAILLENFDEDSIDQELNKTIQGR